VSVGMITLNREGGRTRSALTDAGIALIVALGILAVHVFSGFPSLTDPGGDNDSLLRLVEVRDLLAGQAWFDTYQYRMGPEGGFPMHWSRLVDAPIAAIITVATMLGGSATTGELVALIVWPWLLLVAALFFLTRIARIFAGEAALLPAAVLSGTALYFGGTFGPGVIDHHNVQLTLALGTLAALASDTRSRGLWAGIATALMLAVGMESAPYVAATGLFVAAAFAFGGEDDRRTAMLFGIGFAAASGVCFVATVAPSQWAHAACDAFSLPQMSLAGVGGAGLALIAWKTPATAAWTRKLVPLAVLGVAVAATVVLFFPGCLADPYANLDPRLKTYWLDMVGEAKSLQDFLERDPLTLLGRYVTPALGLVVLGLRMKRDGARRIDLLVLAFLGMAFLVSIWQVRGSVFSIPFAIIPLSGWVADARQRAGATKATADTLKMVAAWILSLNVTWSSIQIAISLVTDPIDDQAAAAGEAGPSCSAGEHYAVLAAMPATVVLATSNFGAPILRNTHHRVLAGPYHRNIAGNLLVLDAFMGTEEQARTVIRDNGVTLLALCPSDDEGKMLANWAPAGLMAEIEAGKLPDWLEPIEGTEKTALRLFRVRTDNLNGQ